MRKFRFPLRLLGLVIGLIVGLTVGNLLSVLDRSNDTQAALVTLGLAIGVIGYLMGPHLSWALIQNGRRAIAEASTLDIIAIAIGLIFGAIVSAALALPM